MTRYIFLVWPEMYGSQSSDTKSNSLFHRDALDVSSYSQTSEFLFDCRVPGTGSAVVPRDDVAGAGRHAGHGQPGRPPHPLLLTVPVRGDRRHVPLHLQRDLAPRAGRGRVLCYRSVILCQASIYPSVIHFVFVPGAPGKPVVSPNVTEIVASKYRIEWTTPSYSHVVEHALIYKQVKVNMFMMFMGKDDQLLGLLSVVII